MTNTSDVPVELLRFADRSWRPFLGGVRSELSLRRRQSTTRPRISEPKHRGVYVKTFSISRLFVSNRAETHARRSRYRHRMARWHRDYRLAVLVPVDRVNVNVERQSRRRIGVSGHRVAPFSSVMPSFVASARNASSRVGACTFPNALGRP